MGPTGNYPRQRGSWTPFVGAALAALTAGSLVVFSLVAQRTSLGGFTTRGVTAIAPSAKTPPSITLPGGATAAAPRSDDADSVVDGAATSLLSLSPTSALLGSNTDSAPPLAPAGGAGTDVAVAPDRTVGPTGDRLQASFSLDGERAILFRDGETGDEEASKNEKGGKHKARSDKGRGKDRGKGRGHGRAKSRNERGGSDRAQRGRASHEPSPGRSTSSAPEHSSRPAPRAKPKKAAKSTDGHSNTKGKGHSKGRGRGHAND